MIRGDISDWREYERLLKRMRAKAIPFATKFTINGMAFAGMKYGRETVKDEFVERNRWTVGSVRALPTRERDIRLQEASFGSTEGYMADQHFGDVRRSSGSSAGSPIPTPYAAGQEGARPRTRLPRRANKMSSIQLRKTSSPAASRKQRTLLAVRDAVNTGQRYVYLELGPGGQTKGIFKVLGGRKNQSRGWPRGARIKMVQNLSHRTIRIPATRWMDEPTERAVRGRGELYAKALLFQLNRIKK